MVTDMLIDELERYLKRLGVDYRIEMDPETVRGLPLFASEACAFHGAVLGGARRRLAVMRKRYANPDDVVSIWRGISRHVETPTVMVLRGEVSEYCRVLEEAGVVFIMPGCRLHIPGSMMLVTRTISRDYLPKKDVMGVSAQQLVLFYLLKGGGGRLLLRDANAGTGIALSHISNAARELERLSLAEVDRAWKAVSLVFRGEKAEVWRSALPFMSSPVMRSIRCHDVPPGLPCAGLSALSEMSMLEPYGDACYAVWRSDSRLKGLEDSRFSGSFVEVWRYDPAKFSGDPARVDPLSLYLSLKDNPDPRVQGELKTMMEKVMEARKW